MTTEALRVIALGPFVGGILPLSRRLSTLGIEPRHSLSLEQLPTLLNKHDVLLTELDWLNGLPPAQREDLHRRANDVAGWIALADRSARFKDQVTWQRLGVSQFFHKPLDPERLAGWLEDIHDRLNGPPVRAILLDDQESSLVYYKEALQHGGIDVLATQDPLMVLEALDAHLPEVLVLDIEMPACRGPELATIIRQHPDYARLPVIFLTAMESMQDKLLARAAAAEDFLAKPVAPELLLATVEAHAMRYRAFRRNEKNTRQQESQARLRLEQLRSAIDEHAIVSITDAHGKIIHVNDKFCTISGYQRNELLGQNHRMVKSGQHDQAFYGNLWRTIRAGGVWHGEVCNRSKNGALYWVEATIVPFRDGSGVPQQYISIRTDITALKASQKALLVSEERLRRGQVFANIGTWDWNIQTGELYWSERIAPLFGHPAGTLETSYQNFLDAIHPDDRQAVIAAVNATVEHDVPYEIEHRVVWPDGQVHWLLERGAVMRDPAGKPLQMLGVVQDIHARKMAEAALAESKERLAFAVEGAGDGIWDWNMGTGAMTLSGHYETMLGYAKGELAPTIAAWIASVHPDDLPGVQQKLHDYLAGTLSAYAVELRLRCKQGDYKWILCRGTVVARDADGQPVRMIGIHSDISAQKSVEVQLIEAQQAAEQANRAKSSFLASMSHELRTPLNAILGFAQMLEFDSELNADQQDSIAEILRAGRHLLELINEVLDLAKVESGRIDLSMEAVALEPLLDDCQSIIAPLAAQRQIVLHVSPAPDIQLFADRTRLKQVLLNLFSNAVKYNREGGEIRLDTRNADSAGRRLRISITDTGPGIPAAQLDSLFQPFNRLDAENSGIEGTGIGLTITRRLVEMMGGAIGVDSQPGIGSTFWIELSAGETTRVGAGGTAASTAAASGRPPEVIIAPQTSVLAIDDNPANLKLVAQILGMRPNIRLHTAHTPELGIELALAHRPALILLDINMPDMDGYQLLGIFKAEPRLKDIPVIAITANAMPRDIEHGLAAGFAGYITKPIDIAHLLRTVDDCLPGDAHPEGLPSR